MKLTRTIVYRGATSLLLLACLSLPAHLPAQTNAAASVTLTLKDAVALALKQNIDVQVATLNMAARQQEKSIARSELLPHATLDASEAVNRFNLRAQFGVQIPVVPSNIGPFQSIHAGTFVSNSGLRSDVTPEISFRTSTWSTTQQTQFLFRLH